MAEMNVHDYMQEVKNRIKSEYPDARMVFFLSDKPVTNDDTGNTYSCGRVAGSNAEADKLLLHIACSNEDAYLMIRNSFLDATVNTKPKNLMHPAERKLRNAIIELAHALNLHCDAKKAVETVRRPAVEEKPDPNKLHKMGMDVKPADIECHISELSEEIKRLQRLVKPETRLFLMREETKRLRRSGKLELAKEREQEMERLQKVLDNKKRMSELGKQNWRKAQEALAEKRRREKQREKDKNRKQPNFQKMAKKKMQQIAARQAEARRKSSGNGGSDGVKSCSMFNNVG